MVATNTIDKDVYDAFKGWSATAQAGFYTFGAIAQALNMRPCKTTSHAIGRAADRLCLTRHATAEGRGIIVAVAPAAPAIAADLAEQLELLGGRLNVMAEQLAELAFAFEDFKNQRAEDAKSAKNGKGGLPELLQKMLDHSRHKLQGAMTIEQVMRAFDIKDAAGRGGDRVKAILMIGEGWLHDIIMHTEDGKTVEYFKFRQV